MSARMGLQDRYKILQLEYRQKSRSIFPSKFNGLRCARENRKIIEFSVRIAVVYQNKTLGTQHIFVAVAASVAAAASAAAAAEVAAVVAKVIIRNCATESIIQANGRSTTGDIFRVSSTVTVRQCKIGNIRVGNTLLNHVRVPPPAKSKTRRKMCGKTANDKSHNWTHDTPRPTARSIRKRRDVCTLYIVLYKDTRCSIAFRSARLISE